MSVEIQECYRCTRMCFCMLIGLDYYCKACFDAMTYEPQQKKEIEIIMSRLGQNIETKC